MMTVPASQADICQSNHGSIKAHYGDYWFLFVALFNWPFCLQYRLGTTKARAVFVIGIPLGSSVDRGGVQTT